jgi:hypothetical protein
MKKSLFPISRLLLVPLLCVLLVQAQEIPIVKNREVSKGTSKVSNTIKELAEDAVRPGFSKNRIKTVMKLKLRHAGIEMSPAAKDASIESGGFLHDFPETNPHRIKQDVPKKDENISNFDGDKWKALSFERKCLLYQGYELGRIMTLERITELKKLLQNVIDRTITKELQEEFINLNEGLDVFLEMLDKYETIVECDDMVSLIDKFYRNPANQSIRIHHAFVINKLIADGEPDEVIKELIDLYRKKDSQREI